MSKGKQVETFNLFWTGGLDSTFRLVQLVLLHDVKVQPFYIIDTSRKSTLLELVTMNKIKELLLKKKPKINELLLPTIFKEKNDINRNKGITESYYRINEMHKFGIQYEWLARYCAEESLDNVEISLEMTLNSEDLVIRNIIGNDIQLIETQYGSYYTLNKVVKDKDISNVFGHFKFPLFDYTKLNKICESQKNGFDDVINLTWFCHSPTRKGKPCGKCDPCQSAYKEGLTWRLPISAKLRYHTWPILRRIEKAFKIKQNLNT